MTLQERLRQNADDKTKRMMQYDCESAADALDAKDARIRELESKLAGNFCDYAETLKAVKDRIKELEGALRAVLDDFYDDEDVQYSTADRAQEALK